MTRRRDRWPLGERIHWSLMLLVTPVVGGFFAYAVSLGAGRWS